MKPNYVCLMRSSRKNGEKTKRYGVDFAIDCGLLQKSSVWSASWWHKNDGSSALEQRFINNDVNGTLYDN